MNIYKQIFKVIKKYDTIVIARHIGADPDALGSQITSILLKGYLSFWILQILRELMVLVLIILNMLLKWITIQLLISMLILN